MSGAEEIFWATQSNHGPNADLSAKAIVGSEDWASVRGGSGEGPGWKLDERTSRIRLDPALHPLCITQFPFATAWHVDDYPHFKEEKTRCSERGK